jgi:adenylyl- and sulfurtransferase ThiI
MKMRTTLTLKEAVKVNDMHRQLKLENDSITFKEVCSIFFKERHKKDIEKAKKEYSKVRAVEKKLKRRKPLQEKISNPLVPAQKIKI